MMQVSSISCPQTGAQCQRLPCLQGLRCAIGNPMESVTVQNGWRCPVCGKGNAPFASGCANPTCGITLNGGPA